MSNEAILGISKNKASTKIVQQIDLPIPSRSAYILSMAFNEKDSILAICSTESLVYFYRGINYGSKQDFKLFKIVCTCQQEC